MKKIFVKILDLAAFALFGTLFAAAALITLTATSFRKRRRRRPGEINELSFAVFDLISNKYSSMFEDALLNGYICRHHYIYIDFANRRDRFENIGDKIFFHSITAHPDSVLYNAGFNKMNMLLVELKALAKAFLVALKGDISFVKAHDPHLLGLNGLITARLFWLPCVLHMNSDFDMKYRGTGRVSAPIFVSRTLERLFESAVINSYDAVMADRELYRKSKSFPKRSLEKYSSFGVRVDRPHYSDPASRRDLKKDLGIEGKKVLLYVGRLHPVKYPEDAVKAFSLVKAALRESVLVIVGTGVLKEALEELACGAAISESVFFLGSRRLDELPDIFHTADALLAPHGGVTLVESALASTPIVAYDFDWHSEFLEDGKMGFIVPFRDVEKMAEKALRILSDESLKENMGAYARKVAMSRHLRETSMENEKKIYERLMAPCGR